jgi:hypothetical protein
MDPYVGLLIYVAITIVSAVLWHRCLPDYVGATLAATATTVALFLFVDRLQSGHWTRNMEIAVLITSVPAAFISLLIGLPPFLARRKARGKGSAL